MYVALRFSYMVKHPTCPVFAAPCNLGIKTAMKMSKYTHLGTLKLSSSLSEENE